MSSERREKKAGKRFYENERRLWSHLPPGLRRSKIKEIFALGFGAVLELGGVAIFLPVISLLTATNPLESYPKVANLLLQIGVTERSHVVSVLLIGLVAYFLFKSIYMGILTWKQSLLTAKFIKYFQDKLFSGYLLSGYEFHLTHHSAQLVARTTELGRMQFGLTALSQIVIDVGILILITGLIVTVRPQLFFVMCIFGILVFVVLRLTKSKLLSLGRRGHEAHSRVNRNRVESITGIKEGILHNKVDNLIKIHGFHTDEVTKVEAQSHFFFQVNRQVVEILAVGLLSVSILVEELMMRGTPGSSMAGTVAFAVGLIRSIPAVNRLSTSIQILRNNGKLFSKVAEELEGLSNLDQSFLDPGMKVPFNSEIQVENVTYQYPNAVEPALKGVNFSILKNQSVGIIGTTGSGKSTVLDILLGLLEPLSGTVRVDGVDIQEDLASWRNMIGYVSQSNFLSDDTIRRNVAFGVPDSEIDERALSMAVSQAQLSTFTEGLPNKLETWVGERGVSLSGGQRQRVAIARALYRQPEILVFDEATSALDNETEKAVMEAIDQLRGSRTLIIVAHRLSTIENCDVIIRLEGGRVTEVLSRASGGSSQIQARQDMVRPIS